jgi:hypothetical protein
MTWQYWLMVIGLILSGGTIFFCMAKLGEKLIQKNNEIEKAKEAHDVERTLQGHDNLAVSD